MKRGNLNQSDAWENEFLKRCRKEGLYVPVSKAIILRIIREIEKTWQLQCPQNCLDSIRQKHDENPSRMCLRNLNF